MHDSTMLLLLFNPQSHHREICIALYMIPIQEIAWYILLYTDVPHFNMYLILEVFNKSGESNIVANSDESQAITWNYCSIHYKLTWDWRANVHVYKHPL